MTIRHTKDNSQVLNEYLAAIEDTAGTDARNAAYAYLRSVWDGREEYDGDVLIGIIAQSLSR
jgi:hypothetical protein